MLRSTSILKIDVPVGDAPSRGVSDHGSCELATRWCGEMSRVVSARSFFGVVGYLLGCSFWLGVCGFLLSVVSVSAQTISPVQTSGYTATVAGMNTTQNSATVTVASRGKRAFLMTAAALSTSSAGVKVGAGGCAMGCEVSVEGFDFNWVRCCEARVRWRNRRRGILRGWRVDRGVIL